MAEIKEKHAVEATSATQKATQKVEEALKIKPEDLTEENVKALAENLVEHTFLPENVIAGGIRQKIKNVLQTIGEKINIFKSKTVEKVWGKLSSLPYKGYTKRKLMEATVKRMKQMAEEGMLMGVKVDGKVVAVAGIKEHGKMPDGRMLYELGKVSTLPEYQGQKLGSKVIDAAIAHFKEIFPGMPLSTASKNPKVIQHFRNLGWQEHGWYDKTDMGLLLSGKDLKKTVSIEGKKEWEKMGQNGYENFIYDPKKKTETKSNVVNIRDRKVQENYSKAA